jgi:hypothetical protein
MPNRFFQLRVEIMFVLIARRSSPARGCNLDILLNHRKKIGFEGNTNQQTLKKSNVVLKRSI